MELDRDIPTLDERLAQAVTRIRERHATDQGGLAAALTALGRPTHASTITRIETGRQQPSLDDVMLLALMTPGGLDGLLTRPFRVGAVIVSDTGDDWGTVTGTVVSAPTADAVYQTASQAITDRRDRLIAAEIGTDARDVSTISPRLFDGRTAQAEITKRFFDRVDSAGPELTDGARRAYRSHAVRNVTSEIRDYLKGQQQ